MTAGVVVLTDDVRPSVGDYVSITHTEHCGVYVGQGYYCVRPAGHAAAAGHVGASTTSGYVAAVDYPAPTVSLAKGDDQPTDGAALAAAIDQTREAREALARAEARADAAETRADALRASIVTLRETIVSHEDTFSRIRDYVIERYRDKEICRDGTNAFLREFEMAPIDRKYSLTYMVTVDDVTVTGAGIEDDDHAENEAEEIARARLADALRYTEGVDVSIYGGGLSYSSITEQDNDD